MFPEFDEHHLNDFFGEVARFGKRKGEGKDPAFVQIIKLLKGPGIALHNLGDQVAFLVS